jgi:hypothetical protein
MAAAIVPVPLGMPWLDAIRPTASSDPASSQPPKRRSRFLLPQMAHQYDEFARAQNVSPLKGWAMDIVAPGATPTGGWAAQYDSARRFIRGADLFGPVVQALPRASPEVSQTDGLRSFVLTTDLKYWYFFMAFFVGLRLSKTTAEVLQARASRK